jgi:hypothetical protein
MSFNPSKAAARLGQFVEAKCEQLDDQWTLLHRDDLAVLMTASAESTDRIGTADRGSVPLRGLAEDRHEFVERGQDMIARVGARHAETLPKGLSPPRRSALFQSDHGVSFEQAFEALTSTPWFWERWRRGLIEMRGGSRTDKYQSPRWTLENRPPIRACQPVTGRGT